MPTIAIAHPAVARPAARSWLSGLRRRIQAAYMAWLTRQVMAGLDPHLCDDIGAPHPDQAASARASVWSLSVPR